MKKEFVLYKGQPLLIGHDFDLYYTDYWRYSHALRAGLFGQQDGCLMPQEYALPESGYRFRFPFPEEDDKHLGGVGLANYYWGLPITIARGDLFPKGHFTQMEGRPNPNNSGDEVTIEIIQQRLVVRNEEPCLALIYRCPHSGTKWRIEQKAEAGFICAQIAERYVKTNGYEKIKDYWRKVSYRILQGYEPSKLEIL